VSNIRIVMHKICVGCWYTTYDYSEGVKFDIKGLSPSSVVFSMLAL